MQCIAYPLRISNRSSRAKVLYLMRLKSRNTYSDSYVDLQVTLILVAPIAPAYFLHRPSNPKKVNLVTSSMKHNFKYAANDLEQFLATSAVQTS